ncbi:hypothetical protein BS47DRAFT_1397371 [Hydnum rufescens UP504]|uniref:Uncharacterized protein n=1 Tax=Hydnum rufescens UP504 TaxID=1448309 RepID=A0A9P6ANM5_9AGAM|nr:hypothetical protein BS47DRAFT_1397371 [Hydnum rufescens UP504]
MENPNSYLLDIRKPRPTSNYGAHANISFPDAGNGGNSENDTNLSSGGRGGDVFLSHSNTNNAYIANVCHIYGHNVGTLIDDAPPSSDIYICLRYGALELRIEFVARLFPFIVVIRRHV